VAKKSKKHHRRFTVTSFLLRFVSALVLVLLTYNPTDYWYSASSCSAAGWYSCGRRSCHSVRWVWSSVAHSWQRWCGG
jgi:hypothetical protein